MIRKDKLVLLTREYPFGKGETFLENEINSLSYSFSEIYIIPSGHRHGRKRKLPGNVFVIHSLMNQKKISIFRILKVIDKIITVFVWTLIYDKKRHFYLKFYKSLIDYAYQDLVNFYKLKRLIIKLNLKHAIFYDYWLINQSLSLIFLKREKIINKIICRAHRFDLYDNVHIENVVPFKLFKILNIDKLFLISEDGYKYISDQYPDLLHKFEISYLGVDESKIKLINYEYFFSGIHLISCARVIPSKNVTEIAKLLSNIYTVRIKWTHFGDGILFDELKKIASKLPENIKVELKGNVINNKIHEFYSKTKIHGFISLSESEGLPFSMMEAQFYGIPIFAFNCNGVSEIVSNETGFLLHNFQTLEKEFKEFLNKLNNNFYAPDTIKRIVKEKFSAERNYNDFIAQIRKV